MLEQVKDYWQNNPCEVDGRSYETIERERIASLEFMKPTLYTGKKILEVGVGSGVDFIQWCKAGCTSYGVDLTQAAINHTKNWLQSLFVTNFYLLDQMDAEHLEFLDNTFDLVYSWGVLHHSPDTTKAVNECIRVCKVGGEIKLMLYNKFSLTWLLTKLNKWFRHVQLESPGTKAFSKNEIKRMLIDCEILEIRSRTCKYDTFWRFPWYIRMIAWAYNYITNNEYGWFTTIHARKNV